MFCPTCGFKQANENPRFCSSCGFLLTGVGQVMSNGGAVPHNFYTPPPPFTNNFVSMRKKGIKQGAKMFLAGMILVPVLGILTEIFGGGEILVGLTAIIAFWGGVLRMIYALVFEANETESLEQKTVKFYRRVFKKEKNCDFLPPAQSIPCADFSNSAHGMWRETADLRQSEYAPNKSVY